MFAGLDGDGRRRRPRLDPCDDRAGGSAANGQAAGNGQERASHRGRVISIGRGRQISLDVARQAARRPVRLEQVPSQAVREADEIQACLRRWFT